MRRVLLALALALGYLGSADPASADLAPAPFWCAAYHPHSGDRQGVDALNYWFFLSEGFVIARCNAPHPAGAAHWYWVTVYADGSSEWTPKNQDTW